MQILGLLIGLCSLVCWIMVIVQVFQHGQVGLGILSIICPLFAFIYGWVKAGEWNIRNLMLAWTGLVVVGTIVNVAGGGFHYSFHTGP